MTDLSLSIEKVINAPAEAVFNAWLDPAKLKQFMIPGEGMSVSECEADARPGGGFKIVMVAGENEIPHSGEYIEIDPHTKLVFTWVSPFSVDGSTVTLDLTPKSETQTHIRLTHVKFPDEESRNNHEGGWTGILNKLGEVAA